MSLFDPQSWFGSGTPSNTTQSSTTTLSPQAQGLFSQIFPMLQSAANNPLKLPTGSGIAPLSPEELQAQQMYKTASAGPVQGQVSDAANANSRLMDPNMMDVGGNPAVKAMMDANANVATRNLTTSILPGIQSGATMAGGAYSGGSTREGIAQANAITGTNQDITNANASVLNNAYNTGVNATGAAVSRAPQVAAAQTMPADMVGAVGAQNRADQQARLDESRSMDLLQQQLPFMQYSEIMNAINGMPGATTTSTSTGTPAQPSWLTQLLGAGATAAGGLAKIFGGK